MPQGRAFLLDPLTDADRDGWIAETQAMAECAPRVTRGSPTTCSCDLCGRAGRWRHRIALAHLVPTPPLGIPVVSLLGANACGRCAKRVKAGDAELIEALKASRRERVRDRVLTELLRVSECGGQA